MKVIYNNLYDDATITASSAEAAYPVSQLKDIRLSSTFRFTGDTSENIVVDLGAAASVDSCGIFGHNLTAGATIKIQGHTSDSWGSPDVDETITAATYGLSKHFTSASKRYWRFTFADAANPDGYIELGRLFLGVALTITKTFSNKFPTKFIDTSIVNVSPGGQVFGVLGYQYREYNWHFPYLSQTVVDSIEAMQLVIQKVFPAVWSIDEDNPSKIHPLYGTIISNLSTQHIYNFYYSGQLAVREAK